MRIGICSIQQSLTPEATNLVKLAISLARRRGHAQVTPLHVASAMLASPTSLLRTACNQSQSHPLQLKALELCFNVALNRLPSSASSPLLGPQTMSAYYPSLSNALVAAFKRAQTHQRRGCVENLQQPILALKIEIEQLVISILDDPSVSRVMREAGLSSPHVKNNVEQVVSMDFCAQNLKDLRSKPLALNTNVSKYASTSSQYEATSKIRQINQFENDDVLSVVHTLTNRKAKSIVIVGETLAVAESVASGVMSKIETGEVDGILRYTQFTSLFNLATLRNLTQQDVEQRLLELRGVIKGNGGRGMALYLGDLKWVSETWSSYACDEHKRNYLYNPVEHIVVELRKLIFGMGESGKMWLMGSASSRTYMKCKLGQPSLESILEFHPIKVPICSLDLSLKIESDMFYQPKTRWFEVDSLVKHNKEDASIRKAPMDSMSSKLPSWLQQCKDEFDCKPVKSPLLKRTRITEKDLMLSMSTPCSPTSVSSSDQPNVTHLSWPAACESKGSPKNNDFQAENDVEPDMEIFMTEITSKPDLLSNPNSSPNSATSSEVDMGGMDEDDLPKFNELNDENLKVLCNALEKNAAPCLTDALLNIATTVLKCRSRAMKRNGSSSEQKKIKEETWMCFLGDEHESKEKAAKELGQVIFGSLHNFIKMELSQYSSDSSTTGQKRKWEEVVEAGNNFLDRFGKAVYENPHSVFYLEGLDQLDATTQKGLQMVIESGNVQLQNGETVPLEDAIVILSCDSSSQLAKGSPKLNKGTETGKEDSKNNAIFNSSASLAPSLDLNIAAAAADEQLNSLSLNSVACNGILESVDGIVFFKA